MAAESDSEDTAQKGTLLDALYRKYNAALSKFLGRRHRLSRDEVADIVQETYCRIHQAGSVDRIRNPKAFLFRVANNVRLNAQKLRRSHAEDDALDIESLDLSTDEPGPYRSLKGKQELAIVRAALEELPPTSRDAFVMNRFENMTYAQVALELHLSVSMIEKHVSHAISYLRKRLEDEPPSMSATQVLRSPKQRELTRK